MITILWAFGAYIFGSLIGWAIVEANRPHCKKGHKDSYCCDRWRCRPCAIVSEQRGLRKLARERTREANRISRSHKH